MYVCVGWGWVRGGGRVGGRVQEYVEWHYVGMFDKSVCVCVSIYGGVEGVRLAHKERGVTLRGGLFDKVVWGGWEGKGKY